MFTSITAFFNALVIFFMSLFGINGYSFRYDMIKDVSYGTEERQVLDIAFPKKATGDVDLILYIHGGAWVAGDKSTYTKEIEKRAKQGYVSASMSYRYASDEVDAFDILDDITAALVKAKEFGKERGINIQNVLLTGHSAGGHLSLLYAYAKAEEAPIKPVAVVDMSGPTDLASREAADFYIFGNDVLREAFIGVFSDMCGKELNTDNYFDSDSQELLKGFSPLYYVSENAVPTVICHGMKDSIVTYSNAVALDKALTEKGVKHDFITYPNSDHDLGDDPKCKREAERLLREYAEMYLNRFDRC